jgi:hydrogenase maturation protease
MTAEHPDALIIGIGNEYRRDDGAGLVVARRLRGQAPAGVSIMEQSGEGAALLEAWKGHTTVFLVDAVDSGAPPGTIHRLDAHARPIPSRFFHGSTHAFSVAGAIELARALSQLPPRLLLYGIQGKNFSAGVGLSAEVDQGIAKVIAQLLGELGLSQPPFHGFG